MPKILIVDDNHLIRKTVRAILGAARHQVVEAGSGLEGLAMARSEQPDLIVLDYMMPDLDGLQMLAQTRQEPALAEIPVVLMTAKAGALEDVGFRPSALVRKVLKPIKSGELLGLVDSILGGTA